MGGNGWVRGTTIRDLEGLSQGSMAPFPTKNQDLLELSGYLGGQEAKQSHCKYAGSRPLIAGITFEKQPQRC